LVPGKLEEYKIRHYFDPLVLSSEYGRRKPDPAIFHHAARLANVPTSKCLYVGDRVARDIIGAHKAGFRLAVQIHNEFNHGEPDEGDIPDVSITHMNELLAIVEDEFRKPDHKKSIYTNESTVQAIFFDAGDVLYYREQIGSRLKKYLASLGLDTNMINKDESRALMVQAHRGQINQDQYRESILHIFGIDQPEQIKHGKQIMAEDDDAVIIFPGVPDTLRSLKAKGILLGVITDTSQPLTVKLNWFERGGFVNVWDSIIPSWEVGINKPHPEIYHLALQQVGVRPDQAIFVGHKAYELAGARSVGMKTVAFNYDEDAKADFYIENFAELLAVPFLSEQKQELLYGK
jgi:putative hydrolase of the HAD superfamily